MGQRHQVYCRVKSAQDGSVQWFAYHHQWCYGTLPLKALRRILLYEKKAQKDYLLTQRPSGDVIKALLSTDPTEGFHTNYLDITDEIMEVKKKPRIHVQTLPNPLEGDNNDGITVMDIKSDLPVSQSRDKIKYCFMDIDHLEGSYENSILFKPMSAEDYVQNYYQKGDVQWKQYKIPQLIDFIKRNSARVLSLEETMEMFPEMYRGVEKERTTLLNIPKNKLPLLINDKFEYELNREFVLELLKKA